MFVLPFRPVYDANGKFIPGAKAWFTLTGTNTPIPVYSDAGLTVALSNPTIASSSGKFPVSYLNPEVTYRVRIYDSGVQFVDGAPVGGSTPIEEYDPYIPTEQGATGSQGNPGGNTMAIGLFSAASTLSIPTGTDLVQTSGYSVVGTGAALYSYSSSIDAAYVTANPTTSFRSSNGRGFKLATGQVLTPQKLGASSSSVAGTSDNGIIGGTGTFAALSADPARTAWDALGTDPTVSGNSLGLTGHQIANSTNSAWVIAGRSSYYSAVGSTTSSVAVNGYGSLTMTYGGDNWNNHLAGFLLSMHSDLIQGMGADGVTPKGSHGFIVGGSFQQVAGDYSGSLGGQMKQVYALQTVALGGKNIKIGSLANVDAVRRGGTLGGITLTFTSGFQSVMLGGESNTMAADNSATVGGKTNSVTGAQAVALGGESNSATALDAVVMGRDAVADVTYAMTRSSGKFGSAGDNQSYMFNARREFTGATNFLSVSGGSGVDLYTPAANSLVLFDMLISIVRTDTPGQTAAYRLVGSCTNIGGGLAIKAQTLTLIHEDDALYNAAAEIVGGSTRLGVRITTPSAGHTVRAAADIRLHVTRVA